MLPGTHQELGSLSLQYLVRTRSSGYVPRRLAEIFLGKDGDHRVEGAPMFSYPAYVVYPSDADPEFSEQLLAELHMAAAELAG